MTTSPVPGIPGGAEISDEVVGRAVAAALNAGASSDPGACDITPYEMSAALAEVVPDLVRAERDRADEWERQAEINGRDWLAASADAAEARAERDRVRRECTEGVRRYARAIGQANPYDEPQLARIETALYALAASWSTPDPGEPQEIARMEYPVTLAAAVGVPDPEHVRRCVVGDDQGRTTFHYDDGGTWVLPGIQELQR